MPSMIIDTQITGLKEGKYSLDVMQRQLVELVKKYSFLTLYKIGQSVHRRPIYCLSLGTGQRRIHANGSHHANEWITSIVLMKSIEIICQLIQEGAVCFNINCAELLNQVTYDFVPMVNPDGVELCTYGIQDIREKRKLQGLNEGIKDFSRWKANIRGIDLNRNYSADFETYRLVSEKKEPSYAYYEGPYPESEPESRALADLTRQRNYDMVLAYHTQGEVIYWNYKNIEVANAKKYATMFSKASGYMLDEPPKEASVGGYKDWFIQVFKKPGYTIECGLGENPIEVAQLSTILAKTLPILLLASKDIGKEE